MQMCFDYLINHFFRFAIIVALITQAASDLYIL